ncbi:unnamed protein product [Symbiodinium necroappetens]|uniref:Uncharacterized protein n=1 Tax=Symbiodinium necroappetens TaxID=1628268 RepID=A0A813BEZ0_9DINO|nr:unnamed protein product [Symbiodinium necroappetens]
MGHRVSPTVLNVSDYLVASAAEIQMEAGMVASRRGLSLRPGVTNLAYLLSERELSTKQGLDFRYVERYGALPSSNPELVYYLGDTAEYCTWSAVSSAIPTYRRNKHAKYWLPSMQRWMTAKERLVSMGFPCTKELAESMSVPALGATDVARAGDLLGNAMHFTTCGIMQLIALSCFGPPEGDGVALLPGAGVRDLL